VWHLGEYPEEYENGKFVKAPAWLAGFEGCETRDRDEGKAAARNA
jgi:hypothetical protein